MFMVFWISLAIIFYVIVGYGLILLVLQAIIGRRPVPKSPGQTSVSFLIPAHNEAREIALKIENTLMLENPENHSVQILVVSDGSTDGTADIARGYADRGVEVLETEGHAGKLAAVNWAITHLTGEIVIFSDANSLLSSGTLVAIMQHFGHEDIGGVCGRISVSEKSKGKIGKAEGIFWRYDQALKRAESDLGGTVSAQGSIYALRGALVAPINPGCADDFVMSVRAVQAGYRLVFEPDATTQEQVTEQVGREMGRRIRSTEMGWRGLMEHRSLLNPVRYGLYAWQLFSHKFLRRMVPFLLVALYISTIFLLDAGWFYVLCFVAQTLIYATALLAAFIPAVGRLPGAGFAFFFVISNVAMTLGLLNYARGNKLSKWTPVRDEPES